MPTDAAVTLADAEREHVRGILRETGWVLGGPEGTAARLGLKCSTLYQKMKKLGISRLVAPQDGTEHAQAAEPGDELPGDRPCAAPWPVAYLVVWARRSKTATSCHSKRHSCHSAAGSLSRALRVAQPGQVGVVPPGANVFWAWMRSASVPVSTFLAQATRSSRNQSRACSQCRPLRLPEPGNVVAMTAAGKRGGAGRR